jgi:hypothetical protein
VNYEKYKKKYQGLQICMWVDDHEEVGCFVKGPLVHLKGYFGHLGHMMRYECSKIMNRHNIPCKWNSHLQ